MAGILYFIEGQPQNVGAVIESHGLGYALDLAHTTLVPIESSSPSGKPGFLLADNIVNSDTDIIYLHKRQSWRKFRDVWVGFYTDNRPTPANLARLETVRGYKVTLADGNDWVVPLIRQQDGLSQLPHTLDCDEDGNWIRGGVIQKYRKLTEIAGDFFEKWHEAFVEAVQDDADTFEFDYEGDAQAATDILSCNYTISFREAALLGLFADTSKHAGQVLSAACDCFKAASWLLDKKKEQATAGLSTDGGAEGEAENTPRLLAS